MMTMMLEQEQQQQQPQPPKKGFAGLSWQVHKFGGTSVANAECFLTVAGIVEDQLQSNAAAAAADGGAASASTTIQNDTTTHLAVVVSAMGGKPKTTDLLLQTVTDAAHRNTERVDAVMHEILAKHDTCVRALFPNDAATCQRLIRDVIEADICDIRDILKTVSLMKWQAARIAELVSGYGELWSTQILAALLNQRAALAAAITNGNTKKQVFVYLDARRVVTVDEAVIQDGAVAWDTSAAKLQSVYQEETAKLLLLPDVGEEGDNTVHWVMTGYVASNTDGVATTLQRDGSDYSAAILGRLLSANSVTIWTDVDGVLSADPRRVPLAQVVPEVSYNEAMELAYFGAKVLHPKTMQPAIHSSIPIYIRNTFNATFPGSRIFTRSTTDKNDQVVCAFSSIDNMAIVNVEGSGLVGVPGVAKRLFGTLERVGVNVVLISQASSEHSITFATTERMAATAKAVIEEEFRRELDQSRISNVDVKSPCSIIAAVGDGMSATTGVSGRFFSALGDAKINIIAIAQGCSERNISAVVRSEESIRALRAVHAAFRLSHTTIRIAIVGMNEVGEALLRLVDAQRGALRATFEVDLQVCVVLPKGDGSELVCLKHDTDASTDSITIGAFNEVTGARLAGASSTSFQDERDSAKLAFGGPAAIREYLWRSTCTNHVIFDCTNDKVVGNYHAEWLRAQVDIVTANNTGLSGSVAQRQEISDAENAHGKQSAKYLREVTVGGGLPVIKTLRTLLDSGDKIRRVDGILSVSLSYIMFRISPPPEFATCREFDERSSNGALKGDEALSAANEVETAVSFSEAVKEAIALGLTEEDPTMDLNNEYTCRVLMVLARELGMARDIEVDDIQKSSEKLLEVILHKEVDYHNLSAEIDEEVKARVDAARSRGCVLRHISSVDVRDKTIEVKLLEVPEHHIFAVTPPSCECVRFFTHHHRRYPLIVQGPSAGADSTASALLAELLHLMRGKATPRSVALSRSASGAVFHS